MTADNDDWFNDAVQARLGTRVVSVPELDSDTDSATMNAALRRAAGFLPPEDDDAERDDLPPAAQGSADGGARQQPAPEPSEADAMNTLLRRRRVTDAAGVSGFYDVSTGVFTPN